MTLQSWRAHLKHDLEAFASLAKEDRTIHLIFGITASAVLWHVRDAPYDEAKKAALRDACGDENHLPHLLKALGGWDQFTPLEAARALSKRQSNNDALRQALTAVMSTFIEELFAEKIVQRQDIRVDGNISGGNIVIGGHQIVAGDLIIQNIRPVISTCPTAPNPPQHFTGREAELRDLRDKLTRNGVVAITAVQAMGGMGKTSLAQALCHQPDKPFDAVLWASLGENPQVTSILMEWARYAVDDYELKPDAKPEEIAAWVRGQLTQLMHKHDSCGDRWLAVFDDVWSNQTNYAAIALLQTALPTSIRTLITTRQANAATHLRATSIELYELSSDDALIMLQRLRSNRHLTDNHLKRAVAIIKGHPLTLEIASASLNDAEDVDDISAILDEYERGIRDGSPFDALNLDVETPRILNVVFGRSYNALSTEDQARFRALGVFPLDANWNRPLAGALWAIDDAKSLTDTHKALRLAAFIRQDEDVERQYGEVYYRQHPLLRAYARALLNKVHESDSVFNRYADYVAEQGGQFQTLRLEEWIQLDPLLPHIEAVGDTLTARYAATQTPDEKLQTQVSDFAANVTGYVFRRPQAVSTPTGTRLRGMNWLEGGLAASRAHGNRRRESLFLSALALAWYALGEKRNALAFFEQALPLFRAVGDRGGEASTLNNIGSAWSGLGEKRKALAFFEQTLPFYRAVGDRGGEASTLNNIGQAWDALGEKRQALAFYEQALPLFRAVGDRGGEASTLNNIGQAWAALGEKRQALAFYEQALPLRRAVGDRGGEATTLNNIGSAWSGLGEKRKALEFFEQALPLIRAVGDRGGEAATLSNIGLAWSALGAKRKALAFFEQALPLQRAVGDRGGEAATLTNIGSAWDALGEKRKVLAFFEQALPLFRAVGDRGGEAATLTNIGSAWDALGEKRKALAFFEQSLSLFRAVGDRGGEAATLTNIGQAWDALGEKRQALAFYEQALSLFRAVGDRGGEATTLNNIGQAWDALGEKRQALAFYEQALPLQRAVGDRGGEAIILNNIGLAWDALGEKRQALEFYEQALTLFRVVGDRRGEGYTLNNMSYIYEEMGDVGKAAECAECCTELLESIQDVKASATRQNFKRLKAKRDKGRQTQDDQRATVMRQLAQLYAQNGEDAVRNALRGQAPDEAIEQIIVELSQQRTSRPRQSTLPADAVQTLAGNTVAVMTNVPEKRDEWRNILFSQRDEWSTQGDSWQIEVEFADALLAILDDGKPALSNANPYTGVVVQVNDHIEKHRKGNG